jgi:hypothetical protein
MMPPGAAESRGAQKAALAGVIYDKKTEAETGALLEKLRKQVGRRQGGAGGARPSTADSAACLEAHAPACAPTRAPCPP